jgi:hypothetical protein
MRTTLNNDEVKGMALMWAIIFLALGLYIFLG